MIDFTWKLFSQTGNIETYLLLKELEKNKSTADKADQQGEPETSSANLEL
ncbi:YqzL family protein [Lentibacillus juripiscarius]|uniref:YqzL family protein n=1 Tax=Lentibacillus juripiscarius TaxID=257446 RepID=A0ABW5V0F0_9BACI